MKKYYAAECGYDVEVFDTEDAARKEADYYWNHLTAEEQKKATYCMAYEIETDEDVEDIANLLDYHTRTIVDYTNSLT